MTRLITLSLLLAATGSAKKTHHDIFVAHQSNSAGFDSLSITVGPGTFIAPFPAGTPLLTDPALVTALAAEFKVRDTCDNVVGVASELEQINPSTQVADSNWTVVVPGRGTLFGAQQEQVAPLFAIVQDMVSRGVLEQTFDPPFEIVTTLPGSGTIIGGTGDFDGARGTMVETDQLYFISLVTGTLTVTDTVEFVWK